MEHWFTDKELELQLGRDIKSLRLLRNIDRQTLCTRAKISMNALRHLENGVGASIKTLIAVVKSLDKTDWIRSIAPTVSINPLHMTKGKPRQRARTTYLKVKTDLGHKKELLKKYGLSIAQYVKMYEFQQGKCGNPGCTARLDLTKRLSRRSSS